MGFHRRKGVRETKSRDIIICVYGAPTSFRYSKDPDTKKAFVANFATDCMLMNPFQIFS